MNAHQLKRIAQTPRAFANWPTVLRDMARGESGRGPESLTFMARRGLRISCPNQPGARVPVYEVFAEDCYRLRWFLDPLPAGPLHVIDIGAHVGAFACQLAALRPDATVQCFEPSARTASYLRRNLEQNGYADRVSVVEQAVTASIGSAAMQDNGAGSALNRLLPNDSGGAADSGNATNSGNAATMIETTTFDAIVASSAARVDVVKIDCEGGEYAAVLGSTDGSWQSVQRVVMEYHPSTSNSWPQLRAFFAERGLHVIREEPASATQGTAWLARRP